jgi:hypothetical protein
VVGEQDNALVVSLQCMDAYFACSSFATNPLPPFYAKSQAYRKVELFNYFDMKTKTTVYYRTSSLFFFFFLSTAQYYLHLSTFGLSLFNILQQLAVQGSDLSFLPHSLPVCPSLGSPWHQSWEREFGRSRLRVPVSLLNQKKYSAVAAGLI